MSLTSHPPTLPTATVQINQRALEALILAGCPFLVGGGYAFAEYTGIERAVKDLDLFIQRDHRDQALDVLQEAGFATEVTFPHWLGKARMGGAYIDLIYSSGNGIVRVDRDWFSASIEATVLGLPVRLTPVEEMIWSKSFVMERDRYDGADIAHLIRARHHQLDWARLLRRFGPDWRVLLSHLVLFGYIYPDHAQQIPRWLLEELAGRLQEAPGPPTHLCRGTLLSRWQYQSDLEEHRDALREARSGLSAQDVQRWTAPETED